MREHGGEPCIGHALRGMAQATTEESPRPRARGWVTGEGPPSHGSGAAVVNHTVANYPIPARERYFAAVIHHRSAIGHEQLPYRQLLSLQCPLGYCRPSADS